MAGLATVELEGSLDNRPSYYFDCVTDLNNGSGLVWTRQSAENRFEVVAIPGNMTGKRLDATRPSIESQDLDVYTCKDTLSDEAISVNITDCK